MDGHPSATAGGAPQVQAQLQISPKGVARVRLVEAADEPIQPEAGASTEAGQTSEEVAAPPVLLQRSSTWSANAKAAEPAAARLNIAKSASSVALLVGMSPAKFGSDKRKKIESLLRQEARQQDEILNAHRRVVGRKDPSSFLAMLKQDDIDLDRWFEHILLRFLSTRSALRIAFSWKLRFSKDKGKTQRAFDETMRTARKKVLSALTDVRELREDVRRQAFEFFEQVGTPLHQRIKEVKKNLHRCSANSAQRDGGKTITSTKHPIFTTVKMHQEELLQLENKLKSLERRMMAFADKREMKLLKASDDPYAAPGEAARKLLEMRKGKQNPVGQSFEKMNAKMDLKVVRQQLIVSSFGPPRRAAKTPLEELRLLREELKLLTDHQHKLTLIRRDLNVLTLQQRAEAAAEAEADEREEAKYKAELRAAESAVTASVLSSVFGAKGLSPAGGGAKVAGALKKSGSSRGWLAVKRAAIEQQPQPMAAPLWVCSPGDGWHAYHGLARSPASRPGTANDALPSATRDPATLDGDVFPLASKLSTGLRQQRPGQRPATPSEMGITPYGLPGIAVRQNRYDSLAAPARWVPVLRPVAIPDTKSTTTSGSRSSLGSRAGSRGQGKSLPTLLLKHYGYEEGERGIAI